jgi:hypothetical protein
VVTTASAILVLGLGVVAGALGALLGLGGGIFLVPFLVNVLHLPFQQAAGVSLMTVIATSAAVSANTAGRQLINVRLCMVLEVATTLGGLGAGVTAQHMSQRTLTLIFVVVTASIGVVTFLRRDRRNVLEHTSDQGRLGGRFHDPDTQLDIVYRVRRVPLALAVSFAAGNVSGLLGIGGGVLKVPALNAWCGVPIRAAAATSALMIGITAASTAPIYYAHGAITPHLAAAGVIGVMGGTAIGRRIGTRAPVRHLKTLMAVVMLLVSLSMAWRLA